MSVNAKFGVLIVTIQLFSFLEYSDCTKHYLCVENLSCVKFTNWLVTLHPQIPPPASPSLINSYVCHLFPAQHCSLLPSWNDITGGCGHSIHKQVFVCKQLVEEIIHLNSVLKGEIVQRHKIAQWLREFNCIKHPKWRQLSWYKGIILNNSILFSRDSSLRKINKKTTLPQKNPPN